MDANTRRRIVERCHLPGWHQLQAKLERQRTWQTLEPGLMVDLLLDAAAPARHAAAELLRVMEAGVWRIGAAAHAGTAADASSPGDAGQAGSRATGLVITIAVAGATWQLRCREQPSLHVWRVTR